MIIKELIDKLKEFSPDMEVVSWNDEYLSTDKIDFFTVVNEENTLILSSYDLKIVENYGT